ncbi:hypothetical protein V8F06_001312 [Rhypophila decipiens]
MSSESSTSCIPSHSPFWLLLLIRLIVLASRFSTRLREYSRLAQESYNEMAEERKLLAVTAAAQQKLGEKSAPTTFPQFGQLPPELRQRIWAEALPGPRVLMLQLPKSETLMDEFISAFAGYGPQEQNNHVWTCSAKIPSILHVNSEARAIALKHYKLGLAPGGTQPRIYVDLKRDVVGLSNELMDSYSGRNLWRLTEDFKKVRHFALASEMAPGFLESQQSKQMLESAEHVAIVDSLLWARGTVPKVAQLDWAHWIKWQCGKGAAHWNKGGFGESEESK